MPKVVAIVNDLMTMTRIRNAAEELGLQVAIVGNESQLDRYARDCELIILDLESDFLNPMDVVTRLKSSADTSKIRLVGFLSHTNNQVKEKALAVGCDDVLSRFEFNSSLKEILQTASC